MRKWATRGGILASGLAVTTLLTAPGASAGEAHHREGMNAINFLKRGITYLECLAYRELGLTTEGGDEVCKKAFKMNFISYELAGGDYRSFYNFFV